MKKVLLILIIFSLNTLSFAQRRYTVDSSIFDVAPFKYHMGSGAFQRSLQMNVNFPAVQDIFKTLDKELKGKLTKRNARIEAHITVITPPEFDSKLAEFISIEEIHQLALAKGIQHSTFDIVCIGKGEAKISGELEETYYLVIQSNALNKLREEIRDLYISRGGNPQQFSATDYYPHITIGYTSKDLHIGPHGVKKNIESCYRDIDIW
ncbi:hypothetical protein A9Q84_08345 [Halobacteriovorax marinus]|uniref:Swiss Army Knife 2H phosphoesterase domain-containing protein n=1 Tax=Halobacteriovorax marinus TaxID=97084 RepID=A0A1Y5F6J6_9BACT|nr:hypothetical protein A9Q84_08345 [Halobacteriovorax marinus]